MTVYRQAIDNRKGLNDTDNEKSLFSTISDYFAENSDFKEEFEEVLKEVTDCFVWGVPNPKSNKKNLNTVCKMEKDDVILFGKSKQIIYVGDIEKTFNSFTEKLDNKKLSQFLWGSDEYELIFFMNNVVQVECDMTKFNEFVGYEKKAIFRGLNVIANTPSLNYNSDGKVLLYRLYSNNIMKGF